MLLIVVHVSEESSKLSENRILMSKMLILTALLVKNSVNLSQNMQYTTVEGHVDVEQSLALDHTLFASYIVRTSNRATESAENYYKVLANNWLFRTDVVEY